MTDNFGSLPESVNIQRASCQKMQMLQFSIIFHQGCF